MFLRGHRKNFCRFLFQNSDFNHQILVFFQNSDLKSEILGGSKLRPNSDFFLRLKSKTAKDQSPHLFWLLSKWSWTVWHQSEVFVSLKEIQTQSFRRPGFLHSFCIFQWTMHSDTLHCFCQMVAKCWVTGITRLKILLVYHFFPSLSIVLPPVWLFQGCDAHSVLRTSSWTINYIRQTVLKMNKFTRKKK